MNSKHKNNFIKPLKCIRLLQKLTGLAGIISVSAALISIAACSQQNPKATSLNTAPSQPSGSPQSSSGSGSTTTTPGTTSTPSSATVPQGSSNVPATSLSDEMLKTLGSMPPLDSTTVDRRLTTIPKTTPPGGALAAPDIDPQLNRFQVPKVSSTIPYTTALDRGYSTTPSTSNIPNRFTVPDTVVTTPDTATPPSRALAPPSTTSPDTVVTTPDTATPPSRALAPPSTTSPDTVVTTPDTATPPNRYLTPPTSTTTPSNLPATATLKKHTSIAASSSSTEAAKYPQQAINDANAVAFGLVVAKHEGQIKPYTSTWRKSQDAISLLRRGKTRQEAAQRAGIPLPLLTQLIEWGENRPTRVKSVESTSIAAANSSSTEAAKYPQQAINDANAVAFGLVVAKHEGQIKPYTSTWRKSQDAISLLRRGKTRQEAAQRAGIPLPLLTQLIEWGENRPTRVKSVESTSIAAANSSSTEAAKYPQQAINDANAVAFGLVVAKHEGQIKPNTSTWRKAQDAISLLRRGKTRQEAAQRAGIPMPLLTQLIEWGQKRP